MTQSNFNISNEPGATFRADNNTALQALATQSSGATAPSTTYPYQFWYDTANSLLKMRNGSNTAWVTIGNPLDTTKQQVFVNGVAKMTVLSGGNVGIGTAAPAYALDVVGDVNVTGSFKVNGVNLSSASRHGECRLVNVAGVPTAMPCDGQYVIIDGAPQKIPSSGVPYSLSGKAANGTGDWYNCYLYMSGSTMTGELGASGTYSHGTDPATGVEVKKTIAGGALDTTRTFVGMIWLSATGTLGTGFADVASYFHRQKKVGNASISSSVSQANGVEVSSSLRVPFLTFGDGVCKYTGTHKPPTNQVGGAMITLDGTSTVLDSGVQGVSTAVPSETAACGIDFTTTEGRHYTTITAYCSGGSVLIEADTASRRGVNTMTVYA